MATPKVVTYYIAADGSQWNTEADADKHDALSAEVAAIMAPLGPVPVDDECRFANGGGFVPHSPEAVAAARVGLAAIGAREVTYWKHWDKVADGTCDLSWPLRMMEGSPPALDHAFGRLYRIDAQGREWGQPFYALNPDRGTQAVWQVPAPAVAR